MMKSMTAKAKLASSIWTWKEQKKNSNVWTSAQKKYVSWKPCERTEKKSFYEQIRA
jgi:hypothetical protein